MWYFFQTLHIFSTFREQQHSDEVFSVDYHKIYDSLRARTTGKILNTAESLYSKGLIAFQVDCVTGKWFQVNTALLPPILLSIYKVKKVIDCDFVRHFKTEDTKINSLWYASDMELISSQLSRTCEEYRAS